MIRKLSYFSFSKLLWNASKAQRWAFVPSCYLCGMSTILVTGCSSGIGFATALELARAGHQVLATMRHPEGAPQLEQTAASEKLPIKILRLDVDSDESVSSCFKEIAEPINVLVNNAGIEVHGSVEELPMSSMIAVFLRCGNANLAAL